MNQLQGGEVFDRLTVVEYSHSTIRKIDGKAGERVMICRCDCGNTVEVRSSNLKSSNTTSCGCVKSENTTKSNKNRDNIEVMTSQNYTYEYDTFRVMWKIIGLDGRVIAEATNEDNADLIVTALNGNAG